MRNQTFYMRIFCSVCLVLLLGLVTQPFAYANSSNLDALFLELKHSENVTEAKALEKQIWEKWMESGDDDIDELLQQAMRKRRVYDFEGSIIILNKIIALKPDFSEAWNQRATLYFYQEKYEESLIDIAKTLELEPRHFGSLAGRAVIRWRQAKPALARQNIIEALKVHPFLKEQKMFPGLKKS